MPFVIPKVIGFEEGRSFRLLTEQCKPNEDQLHVYIAWLESELVVARVALGELNVSEKPTNADVA